MKSYFILLIALISVAFVLVTCTPGAGQGPSAWIDRPLDGQKVPLEPVTLQAHASDVDGVAAIEFSVGDISVGSVPTAGRFVEGRAGWSPPAPGTYLVRVRAVDAQGNRGAEVTAQIIVGEIIATPTPAPLIPTLIPSGATSPPLEIPTLPLQVIPPTDTGLPPSITHPPPRPTTAVPPKPPTFTASPTLKPPTLRPPTTAAPPPTTAAPPPTTEVPPPVCPGAPSIEYFNANPGTINAGQSSTLSWGFVANADSVEIDQDIGGVATPGSITVQPGETTTYTLTATGCGGTAQRRVTVNVTQPPPPPPPTFTVVIIVIDNIPPYISEPSASPSPIWVSGGGCPGKPRLVTVRSKVEDVDSGVQSVLARWSLGGDSGESGMAPAGGKWYQTTLGEFSFSGTLSIFIVATDNAGNTGEIGPLNVQVNPCIE